jgi:hypothetical protein
MRIRKNKKARSGRFQIGAVQAPTPQGAGALLTFLNCLDVEFR